MTADPLARIERIRNLLALVGNVRPASAKFDSAYVRLADPKICGDVPVPARVISYGANRGGGEDRIAMPLATRHSFAHRLAMRLAASGAPAVNPVLRVVLRGSPPKMSRIAASGIIARVQRMGALEGLWNLGFKRETMRWLRAPFAVCGPRHKLPIAVAQGGQPRPALIGATSGNFAGEPLIHRLYGLAHCSPLCKGRPA